MGGVDVRAGGDEKQFINFAWPKSVCLCSDWIFIQQDALKVGTGKWEMRNWNVEIRKSMCEALISCRYSRTGSHWHWQALLTDVDLDLGVLVLGINCWKCVTRRLKWSISHYVLALMKRKIPWRSLPWLFSPTSKTPYWSQLSSTLWYQPPLTVRCC